MSAFSSFCGSGDPAVFRVNGTLRAGLSAREVESLREEKEKEKLDGKQRRGREE